MRRGRETETLNVLLVAEDSVGLRLLSAVARGPHELVGVLASPPPSSTVNGSVWTSAQSKGLRVWPATSVRDAGFARTLRDLEVDVIINAYSLFIMAPEVLASPRIGAFNLHPGPLPRYAGLNSTCWAIYHGERDHGVTTHWMVPQVDAGPIALQTPTDIDDNDTGLSLTRRCIDAGLADVRRLLDLAAVDPGALPRIEQDLSQRTYFPAAIPRNGRIDWRRPAREVFNFVRACDFAPFPSPWGNPTSTMNGQEIRILKVALTDLATDMPPGRIVDRDGPEVFVACGQGVVAVRNLRVSGAPAVPSDVLKPGDRLGEAWSNVI